MPKAKGLQLFLRGDTWYYRGTINRQLYRGSTRTRSKEEAREVIEKLTRAIWSQAEHAHDILVFSRAVVLYIEAGHYDQYLDVVTNYWRDTPVEKITGPMIREAAIKQLPTLSPSTRNRMFVAVTQSIINHAAKRGLCQRISVERFKTEQVEKDYATWEWVTAIRPHLNREMAGLMLFLFLTGARVNEALSLDWSKVDLEKGKATIHQRKIKKDRVAMLPQILIDDLRPMREGKRPEDKVWSFNINTAWTRLKRAHATSGLKPLNFHSCRHGFATGLMHKGVDVITIARLGGWSSPAMVLNRYGHAKDDPDLVNLLIGEP